MPTGNHKWWSLISIVAATSIPPSGDAWAAKCDINARLDQIAKQATKHLVDHEARLVAVWPLSGGLSNSRFRDYVARELIDRLSESKSFRIAELPETIAAAKKAKLVGETDISQKAADRLGKISRIDALIGLRFEPAPDDGLTVRAKWYETYRGRVLGRTTLTICRDARLDELVPLPKKVSAAPPPVAPPPPPVPPAPVDKAPLPPPVAPPPAVKKPAIYKADLFELELKGCKRAGDAAASLQCDFIVTALSSDIGIILGVKSPVCRAFLDTKELKAQRGMLGTKRGAHRVAANIPSEIKVTGSVTFQGFPAVGDRLTLLRIPIHISGVGWHNADFRKVVIE